MDVFDAIRQRRSVKCFDSEHVMPQDELRRLLEAAALAPTSFNIHNRHLVAVLDPEVKEQLMAASWGQAQVRDASVCVVITGDLEAHQRTERYLRHAPPEVQQKLGPMACGFYEGNEALLRDEACRTAGLVGMNLMLAASAMGYDSCPMIGYDPARFSEILGLDEQHPPLLMVVIGKATQPARARMGLLDFEEQVSIDRFGNHSLQGPLDHD